MNRQQTCSTCGSDDRRRYGAVDYGHRAGREACKDRWHLLTPLRYPRIVQK